MSNKFEAICNLRSLLRTMERDLGLDHLSTPELDVFLAAQSICEDETSIVTSSQLRNHQLVSVFPPATYHRALRALVERGYLRKADGAKAKSYMLCAAPDAMGEARLAAQA